MLDIGGGVGLFSFYAACCGASHVACLKPESEGSSPGMVDQFQEPSTLLGLDQVSLRTLILEMKPWPLQRQFLCRRWILCLKSMRWRE